MNSISPHDWWELMDMSFLYRSWSFVQLKKTSFGGELTASPTTALLRSGVLDKIKFCVHIWTFHVLSIKKSLVKLPWIPLYLGVRLAKPDFVHFWMFNTNSNTYFFSELSTNLTCWRENPYHSWESQFLITLYSKSNSCVLEIVFGATSQMSRASICCWRYFV